MKHFLSTLFVVFFATSMMAQTGLSCEDPIPVNKDYRATIDGPCELWYTANTYDLPLHVYFSPNVDNSTWGPEVMIDFTCDEGVYDDPMLDSLVNMVEDFNITFPIELLCELVVRDGKNEWDLSVAKSYRDQLSDFGVTYPVQAFVKVTYFEGGTVSLTPDTAFSSCMERADYVNLGDTLDVFANDVERVFAFPYTEWQEDSIRFVWTGTEPVQVFVAVQECEFTPVADNPFVFDNFSITQDAPHKMYSDDMKADIKAQKDGGVYFAKVIASGAGQLVVEKIPLSSIEGDAQLLEHGTTVAVQSEQLYCFPKTWTATQILAATSEQLTIHISNVADFEVGDENVLMSCPAFLEGSQRAVYLSGKELANLAEQATGDYLYVRFSCAPSTKVSINAWEASECADESILLTPNMPQFITAKSVFTTYRVRYADFSGYPLTIKWSSSDRTVIYIAETCDFSLTTNNEALLLNPAPSIAKGGELLLESAEIDSWASRIAEDGYFYVRLDSKRAGEITFITEKTEETPVTPDSIYTTETATVCFGEAYEWNGKTYTETGKYTYTTVAANGADSIVTLNLTIYPKVPVTKDTAAICYGETYPWQGQEYTASGEYSVTLKNVNGCDSIVTLNLTVYPQTPATTEEATIDFGTTYDWHGTTYTESGEYTTTLQDENGCDYQATLILTILPEEKPEFAYPVVASSDESLLINYPLATQVYGIEYLSWQTGDVTLAWSGATPLYVFIAKVADFAVAVHHKNVVKFIEVPAEGSVVLPKSELQALNRYATEEGYLYVRFLTEKEGVLTTAQAE